MVKGFVVRVAFAILYDNDFDLTNYTIANYTAFERVRPLTDIAKTSLLMM